MTELMIGTVGSPELLSGDFEARRQLMNAVSHAGVDHLFIADHVSFHTGLGMDGIVNAATLAAMHPSMKIVIGVYLLALRHPVVVARQLSSLALSAPGRIVLGVGVGGEDRHEMEVCGVDPATRGKRTNHCLEALRGLLAGNPVDYNCEFFEFENALVKPAPRPAIPIVVGGRSDAAIERTARFGDGWLGVWCSPGRFGAAINEVAEKAGSYGRTDVNWQHGLQVWVGLDSDKAKAREHLATQMEAMYRMPFAAFEKYSPYGTPAEVADFLVPYIESGANVMNIKPCAANESQSIELVAEVCSRIREAV